MHKTVKKVYLDEYVRGLEEQQFNKALLPKVIVAEYFGRSLAWVTKKISNKELDVVEIYNDSDKCIGKLVSVESVIRYKESRDEYDNLLTKKVNSLLEELAHKKKLIEYAKLMGKVGLSSDVPADRGKIGSVLGEVSKNSVRSHGVMLSAVVVSKNAKLPSDSFFELAKEIDRDEYYRIEDYREYWEKKRDDVYKKFGDK